MKKSFKLSTFYRKGFRTAYVLCWLGTFSFIGAPLVQAKEAKTRLIEQQVNMILNNFQRLSSSSAESVATQNHFPSDSKVNNKDYEYSNELPFDSGNEELLKSIYSNLSETLTSESFIAEKENILKVLTLDKNNKTKTSKGIKNTLRNNSLNLENNTSDNPGAEGIIGLMDGFPFDNPSDNVFRVHIDQLDDTQNIFWLQYDLYGVTNSSAASITVNGNEGLGGYMIKTDKEWKTVKEPIVHTLLNQGENYIRFAAHPNSGVGYKVKNVEITSSKEEMPEVVFSESEISVLKEGKAYVSGVLRNDISYITINNKKIIPYTSHSFEDFIAVDSEDIAKGWIDIKAVDKEGKEVFLSLKISENIQQADLSFEVAPVYPSISRTLNAVGGSLKAYGAELYLQEGALSNEKSLSITELRKIDLAPMNSGLTNVTLNKKGYRFLPHGIIFEKEGKVAIPYDEKLIPSGNTPEDIRTFYFDESSGHWTALELDSIDLDNRLIISRTDHFTDMINGVIQVPEAPQNNAFAPTMMGDIQAANPLAGINLMQPPTASQDGAAHISYPLNIPAGRGGMQPGVTLNYNSEGGNGWMGLGWNIATPAITIDTRWGVPEFDSDYETEIYMLNGEQLVYPRIDNFDEPYMPHRHRTSEDDGETLYSTELKERNDSGSAVFYLRNGGSITKIERLGEDPAEYYWKVTSTDGTVSWYGGYENEISENSIIRKEDDNVVHWGLTKVVDVYGNIINYSYNKSNNELYLDVINYTGKEGENGGLGKYSIKFTLDGGNSRPDVSINARLGIEQVLNRLLTEIEIKYDGSNIRSYEFSYNSNNLFKKTLLTEIIEYNESKDELQRHTMSYFDDVGTKQQGAVLFSEGVELSTPNIAPEFKFNAFSKPSKLGSSQNTNLGWGVSGLLGLEITIIGLDGFHKTTQSKTENFTIGTGYFENYSTERGMVSLIDINGDGFKDILYRTKNGVKYYPHKVKRKHSLNGEIEYIHSFENTKTLQRGNEPVYNFSTTKGKTVSKLFENFEVNFGSKHLNIVGHVNQKRYVNDYSTSVYFIDANNDGLPDIVDKDYYGNQVVYFNRIENGVPTFIPSSSGTPNLLIVAETGMSESEYDNPELDEGEMNYDAVRMWQAPFRGTIKIEDQIQILGDSDDSRLLYTIETALDGNSEDLYRLQLIDITDHSVHSYTMSNHLSGVPLGKPELNGKPIEVQAGQKILFRIHNLGETNEELNWNPKITYLSRETVDPDDFPEIDQNNKPVVETDYKESFLISNKRAVKIEEPGFLYINWNEIPINTPSDTVYFRIYIDSPYPESPLIFEKKFDMGVTDVFSDEGGVSEYIDNKRYPVTDLGLRFTVESDSNIKWQELEWKPEVTFTPDSNPNESRTTNAVPEYTSYELNNGTNSNINSYSNFTVKPRSNWIIPNSTKQYGVKPNLNFTLPSEINGFFNMIVKSNGLLLGKKMIKIQNGVLAFVDNDEPVIIYTGNLLNESAYKNISIEFYADNEDNSIALRAFAKAGEKHAIIGYDWSSSETGKFHKTDLVNFYFRKSDHGPMISNWGQFYYNGSFNTNESSFIPSDEYGKLIDYEYIDNPLAGIDMEAILNNLGIELDPEHEYTQEELDQILLDALDLPDENATEEDWEAFYDSFGDGFLNPVQIASAVRNSENEKKWIGIFSHQFIKDDASYLGDIGDVFNDAFEDEVPDPVPIQMDLDTGMYAMVKKNKSSSYSFGVNYDKFGYTESNSGNGKGYNYSYADFMDFNGDGYPDLIYSIGDENKDMTQITNMTGGHRSKTPIKWGQISNNVSKTKGLSLSYSPNIAGLFSSGNKAQVNPTFTNSVNNNNSLYSPFNGSIYNAVVIHKGSNPTNVSLEGNLEGYNETQRYWLDLNGDGLPDLIKYDNDGVYKYWINTGFKTSLESNTQFSLFNNLTRSRNVPAKLTGSIGGTLNLSEIFGDNLPEDFNFGLNISAGAGSDFSNTEITFTDVNGDGLVDLVRLGTNDNYFVHFNNGNGFDTNAVLLNHVKFRKSHDTITFNAGIDADIFTHFGIFTLWVIFGFIPVPLIKIHGKVGISAQANGSITKSDTRKSFEDIDGDGYPDYVEKDESTIKVYYSNIRRTNKLKSVTNPVGGSFELDYTTSENTYDMPSAKWTLSKVSVSHKDPFADAPVQTQYFQYEDGYYDRREREFYGFETVKIIDLKEDAEPNNYNEIENNAYRTQINRYHNRSYFLKGNLKESYTIKGGFTSNQNYTDISVENLYSKTVNTYEINPLDEDFKRVTDATLDFDFDTGGSEGRNAAITVLSKTESYFYNMGTVVQQSKQLFEYDEYARVTKMEYEGDPGVSEDNYISTVTYHDNPELIQKNIISIPKSITVAADENGDYLRKRTTSNIDLNTGAIGRITAHYTEENTEVEAVTDMTYDNYGNLASIEYPENLNQDRVKLEYEYDDVVHTYVTKVEDNLGYYSESLYDLKTGNILEITDANQNKVEYEYDEFNRLIQVNSPKEPNENSQYTLRFEYYPEYITTTGNEPVYPYAITKHFDSQHPENPLETYTFTDGFGNAIQVKKDIDLRLLGDSQPNERMIVSGKVRTDIYGRAIEQYHPLSEPKSVEDNKKLNNGSFEYPTKTQYDEFDRVVEVNEPDGGTTTLMDYEIVNVDGKALMKTTATVKQNDIQNIVTETFTDVNGRTVKVINGDEMTTQYRYDNIGQLMEIEDAGNNLITSVYDQLGRRVEMTHPDAGTNHYWYDPIGNLVKMQTPNLTNYPVNAEDRFIKYDYDELNRLISINYPDLSGNGNLNDVAYIYGSSTESQPNAKGKLIKMTDATGDQEYKYGNMGELIWSKRQIAAPNLPNRSFIHKYEYDSHNRLLNMTYPDYEKVSYFYDLGGNLTKMTGKQNNQDYDYIKQIVYDEFEQRTAIKYGNNTVNTYEYDSAMRRLETMTAKQSNNNLMIDNKYEFDLVGNITNLESLTQPVHNKMGGTYYFEYEYDEFNRLEKANGDFTGYTGTPAPTFGDLSADFSLDMTYDVLHNIETKNQTHIKNAQTFEPNTYVNEYVYSQTKPHQLESITNTVTQETEHFGYDANGNLHRHIGEEDRIYFWDEENRLRSLVIDDAKLMHYIYDAGGERTLKASGEYQGVFENGEPTDGGATLGTYTTYPSPFITLGNNNVYTKHYYAGDQRIASTPAGDSDRFNFGFSQNLEELRMKQLGNAQEVADTVDLGELSLGSPIFETAYPQVYYFHPDHLGSSTMISDGAGYAYQMFLNLPFGETMAEQRRSGQFNNPYKFNGKELDSETNLYYYGARYYDPRISNWLSVDPLAEQAPDWSPYRYGYNNPIRYTDPTGMWEDDYQLNANGGVDLIRRTNDRSDTLYASNNDGSVNYNKSVTVSKENVNSESVISELAGGREWASIRKEMGIFDQSAFRQKKGQVALGYTNDVEDAVKVFNFAIANTSEGVEFGLMRFEANGNDNNYLVGTQHSLETMTKAYKSMINYIGGYNNLMAFYHNHDDNDIGRTIQWFADQNTRRIEYKQLFKNSNMVPRLFTVHKGLGNLLIEYNRNGYTKAGTLTPATVRSIGKVNINNYENIYK